MRVIVILLFGLLGRLSAQSSGDFSLLSVNEGLSQGMVFDIYQSRDGYLWIATKDGLNRYDGYRFEIFSPDPFDPFSIATSMVYQIFEDSRGLIWLSYHGGVDILVRETGRFFHLPIKGPPEFNGLDACFCETPDGAIWMVDQPNAWKIDPPEQVLLKAEREHNPFPELTYSRVLADGLPGADSTLLFNSVYFTRNKTLLFGSNKGLYRMQTSAGVPRLQRENSPDIDAYIFGEDQSGRLWTATLEALWVKPENGNWFSISQQMGTNDFPFIRNCAWLIDPQGFIWNQNGNTLRRWEPSALVSGAGPVLEASVLDAFIRTPSFYFPSFIVDRSGIAWLGTAGFGLMKLVTAKPKFKSYLPVKSQRMLYEDPDGNLFVQFQNKLLFTTKQFDRWVPNPLVDHIPGNFSYSNIAFDREGNGWANDGYGTLYRVDAQTKQAQAFHWKGLGLLIRNNGKLLGVGENGLIEFDPQNGQSVEYAFTQNRKPNYHSGYAHHYFYEGSDGAIWIFPFEGLTKATPVPGGYQFDYFNNNPADRSSLSANVVLCAMDDPVEPQRYLWVGTKGGGLNRLDRQTGKFKHYKTEQGLPDNVVYGILTDNSGHLWMSTNKGLCRFHVRDETVKNFTVADGLQNDEFNQSSYLKMRDGTMLFGGVNGVTVFHPDSLRFNERKPQTVFTRIWVNSQRVRLYGEDGTEEKLPGLETTGEQHYRLALGHNQNFLSLEFAALDFSNPSQNQYRYQLIQHQAFGESAVDKWVEMGGKNTVQFANLRPGHYTFKVLGSNNDGIWSEQPVVLELIILPPWWAGWWAYAFYALVVGSIAWLFYRYQVRQKLEHQETRRLRELDEFKNRFFTNITHEFRTPLTVILGTLDQAKSEAEGLEQALSPKTPRVQTLLSKLALVKRNGENLLRLINQILDLAKLESHTLKLNNVQGDVLPYLRYIAESLHSLANAQNVMLRVDSDQAQLVMDYDPERLLQVVHNLLSNAIKFTPGGGRVDLRVTVENASTAVLTVTDSGTGIPPEDLPHIFDRFYQANNLEKARTGGTGIGLSLTKELVRTMGGAIFVESKWGMGSTFTVRLPITHKSDKQAASPENTGLLKNLAASVPIARSGTGPLPSLLIVEDNPDVVEYLDACLRENYALDFAYNGRAGIEKALDTMPDLIISDVMMPEKDGFEVCDTLKTDERTSHIPIVLLTAKADMESRIAGLKRGADAYLAKPFHQEELQVTLANLLELRRRLQAKYAEVATHATVHGRPPVGSSQTDPENAFLLKLRHAVEARLGDPELSSEDICRAIGMGRSNLYAKLSALTGLSFNLYLRALRLHRAKELLLNPEMNIAEVAFEVGFNDPKYFSRVFSEEFGLPPSAVKH